MVTKPMIAWLAGIIDGEGSVTFTPNPTRKQSLCRISITNTDEGILNEVKRILEHWLVFYTLSQNNQNKNKPCFQIIISRQAEIVFVLEQVSPYMKSIKREKYKLVADYMRQKDALGRKKNYREKNYQYGLVEQ